MKVLTQASFALVMFAGTPLKAQSHSTPEFIIKGNERTRTGFIERIAKTCLADLRSAENPEEERRQTFEQCLMNARIFAKVEADPDQNPIPITVEEKWTLIPAPFFQSSGSTRKAGIIVFETNFLGQGLMFAVGGNTGNKGNGFVGMFNNPSILESNFFTSLSFAKEQNIYERIIDKETVSQAFNEKSIGYKVAIGYRFPWFNFSSNLGRTERNFDEHDNYAPPSDYILNRWGISLDYDRRDYKLYFSDGIFARTQWSRSFAESDRGKPYLQWEANASWQRNVVSDHALLMASSIMAYDGGRMTDSDRIGSTKGFRGIETKTAWAKKYFVQTAEYQIPLKSFDKGTLTSAVFYDHGRIENRGFKDETTEYNAGGLGLYFYLSHIAIPGLGLEWGSNSKYQKSFINFSVGLSY